MVGDVALAAIARAGYHAQVQMQPWARAQKRVSAGHDLLIIPLSRTPLREDSYTWIAPIMRMERAFFSLHHKVDSFAEAKRRFRLIGVGLGSAQHEILRTAGFPEEQLYPLTIGENPARLLELGRIDAWFNGVPESPYIWKRISQRPLLMGKPMAATDLYLACAKDCDPALVAHLRQAVEELRAEGTLQRLLDAYAAPAAPE